MELTSSEGTRLASASHAMQPAIATRTRRRQVPVRVEGPVRKDRTADKHCAPSFRTQASTPQHRCSHVVGRARRRSLCLRCTCLIPEVSLPVAGGACTHGMLAHHTVLTCVLASCARRRWKGSGAHIQWISLTVHVVGSCIGWWSILVCNYLQQDAARDA